jgi:hypothetical protein
MFKARLVSGILNIPNEQMNLAGYSPPRNFKEIHDQLEYNFFLINEDQNKVIIFGSIDCLFLDKSFINDLKKILGKNYEFCIFASHTHNAPSLSLSTPLLGKVYKDFYKQALHKISSDILKNTNLTEINYIKAGSQETNLNINRRKEALIIDYKKLFKTGILQLKKGIGLAPNPKGVIDKTLKAIFFLDNINSVKVIVWSLAAHAAFFPIFDAISSDFPGFVRERLRKIWRRYYYYIFARFSRLCDSKL